MRRAVPAMIAVAFLAAWPAVRSAGAASPEVAPTVPPTVPPSAPPTDGDEGVGVSGVDTGELPPVTLPLVPVPIGCPPAPQPHVVFVGRVVDRDYRSVQFEIEQVRAGDPAPFARGTLVNVRYGLDAQYLADGERYLVSAPADDDLGLLVSRVGEPPADFGGDEVIGISESDVTCPTFDDPARTVHRDGTPVATAVLEPLFGAKARLLAAVLLPIGVAFGVVFILAALRLSVTSAYSSIAAAGQRRV